MKVSCGCPRDTASPTLCKKIQKLGVTPIITDMVIRAVYEGPNRQLGEAIVRIFGEEVDSDITAYYDKEESHKAARRLQRKLDREIKNNKLHGH